MTSRKLLKNTLVRYIFIGGSSYAIELAFLLAIVSLSHVGDTIAAAIAFWIGLAISFLLQKLLTFSDRNKTIKHLSRQTVLYAALVLFNYVFTIGFIYLFRNYEIVITRTIALVITTTWNYIVYRYVIFK